MQIRQEANSPQSSPRQLRPMLRWMLGLSIGGSVWAFLLPSPADAPADSVPRSQPPGAASYRELLSSWQPAHSPLAGSAIPLPSRLPENPLEAADRNPFSTPQQPAPPAPPALALEPAPPPAPQAPALTYRYLGEMLDAQGQRRVYLAKQDKELLVETGTRLDEGYRVESITADEIRLIHEALQQQAVIRIPAKPAP